MSDPKRAHRAFVSHNPVGQDPASAVWTSAIPMTWMNGYEAAMDDSSREARLILEEPELTAEKLWKFLRLLAYDMTPTAEGVSDPIQDGWQPTRNGNYRKMISGHNLVIFKNPTMDGKSILWGYGVDGKYNPEVKWLEWQGAAEEAAHDLERQIAEAVD